MAFGEGAANKDETILAIKRKYLNTTRKQGNEEMIKTPGLDKNAQNKDKYYESPSHYMSSIGQSTVKNSLHEAFKDSEESNTPYMRDYTTLKTQYTLKNRNKSVNANNKSNIEPSFGYQNPPKENGGMRRHLNKINKQNGKLFVSCNEDQNLANKWNHQRIQRKKQLEQIQTSRANQGRVLKQMNRKAISEIEQMLMKIKCNLKERNS